MYYVKMAAYGRAVEASTTYPGNGAVREYETRNDWKTLARAEEIATQLTEATGETFLATDAGPHCSPRFDIVKAPVVGALVSRSFNGDSYPAGEIAKVSPSFKRVETTTGVVFYRHRTSGSWIANGTWSMASGHHTARNPSF